MAACAAIVRRTFLELDSFEESDGAAMWGRPRADTDSMVDYGQFGEEFGKLYCRSNASSLRTTTVGESSSIAEDAASSRGSRWEDDMDESDSDGRNGCVATCASAGMLAAPPGCNLGPPGCHLAAPVFFVPVVSHKPTNKEPPSSERHKNARVPRQEVTETSTLVLRNLPEQFVVGHVRKFLNAQGFAGKFNFVYVPANFKKSKTLRYAIVNFVSVATAELAKEQLDGAAIEDAVLEAQLSTSHAGLASLVERYRHSPVMTDPTVPKCHRPVLLVDGVAVAFPWPSV